MKLLTDKQTDKRR